MPVGSATYFLFLGAVFFLYWTSPQSRLFRLSIVLLANYFFCARYGLFYLALLPACATLDYWIGRALVASDHIQYRRLLVALSILANLALLVASRHTGWIFPLGLSFYTLQSLTYTIDLYRRDGEA